jgi:transcriptional regulator with XRE-family HTH domain
MAKPANICGPRVKRLRLALGLTVEALSGCVSDAGGCLTPEQIIRIESRGRRVLDYELVALARALRTTVGALLGRRAAP